MKIIVNNKMLERFLEIMEANDEFVFGSKKEIKKQLEICLNRQGYWSGCDIRVYYNKYTKDFTTQRRFLS